MWNVLHVPSLRNLLYSLQKHLSQRRCRFISDESLGAYTCTFFPLSCQSTPPKITISATNPLGTIPLSTAPIRLNQGAPSRYQHPSRNLLQIFHHGWIDAQSNMHATWLNMVNDLPLLLHMTKLLIQLELPKPRILISPVSSFSLQCHVTKSD